MQILTAPITARFCYYVFHSSLAPTCFGLTANIKELTSTETAKTYLYVTSCMSEAQALRQTRRNVQVPRQDPIRIIKQ